MVSKGRYFLFTEIICVILGNSLVSSVITDVRLVGGPTSNKGTVEIRRINNGAWETTCGASLDISDVMVICRQLGFTGASMAIQNTPYGRNSTLTTGLSCRGGRYCRYTFSRTLCSAGAASCHGESYLGCFVDLWDDRVFPGDRLLFRHPDLTISYCIKFCIGSISANYVYAGVENGEDCFCGEASDDYSRHGVGTDANCQIPCSGDPTDSCGAAGYIAVFRIETLSTTLQQEPSSPETTTAYRQESDCSKASPEVASTIAVGILLALVTLYGFIITWMYLHLRRSIIALKQSFSDRVGQELDTYTSLDATTIEQPAYDDTIATRHGNRGHTNAIEGVEYGNQRIVEQAARVQKPNLGVADENIEPEYELLN